MLVDLVQVTTSDAVRLHGALELAQPGASPSGRTLPLDAWLCLHGTGSNFYAASTLGGLAPKLLAGGAAVLRANTRGHDIISTGPAAGGRELLGAAFERVDEAPRDVRAWIDFLGGRGFARIGLLGHSMGAIKAICTLALDGAPRVAALVAVSPPRLSYSHFCASPRADEFRRAFAKADEFVRAGRGSELMLVQFPLPIYISAAGFVDRYGPQEKYNVLGKLARVACPTLVTFGSSEVQANEAFRGMPEAVEALCGGKDMLQVAVIAGADHIYTGCHDALAAAIAKWTREAEGGRQKAEG
jgi:pimeloyl-ACP methyl ester carboxylesterase